MAIDFSTLRKPVSPQVVDPSTGRMREEWQLYFDQLTTRLNGAVGELGVDAAPAAAQYLVGATDATLTAERVVTNTATATWDLATPGQAKVNVGDLYVNAAGDTMTGLLEISINAAGSGTEYLRLKPSDWGTNKSYLFFKSSGADVWQIGAWDGTDSNGTLAFIWGALTNNGNRILEAGKQSIWVPAGALALSGSGAAASNLTVGDIIVPIISFDPTTFESAFFSVRMPKSWNVSSVTFQVVWSHAATVTNFGTVWQLAVLPFSDGDLLTTSYADAVNSTDTGGTTNTQYISPESAAISFTSPTASSGDVIYFRISRFATDGSDTMTIDARLHGVMVFYTTDAPNDA